MIDRKSYDYKEMKKRVSGNWRTKYVYICETSGTGHELKAIGIDILLLNDYISLESYKEEFGLKIMVHDYNNRRNIISSYSVEIYNKEDDGEKIYSALVTPQDNSTLSKFLFMK